MILSSILLVLVACVTLVMGVRDASMGVIATSIGCGVVAGGVLVMSVRERRRRARDLVDVPDWDRTGSGELPSPTWWGDPVWATGALAQPQTGSAGFPVPVGGPARTGGATGPPVRPLIASPSLPPTASATHVPKLDLQAPGPGALGRIRRPPLAQNDGGRPPVKAGGALQPRGRRPTGEACASARQPRPEPRSASADRRRAVDETRDAAGSRSNPRSRGGGAARTRKRPATATPARPQEKAGRR